MEKTMILEPIDNKDVENPNYYKNQYKDIFEFLKELGTRSKMTFDEFLLRFNIDNSTYIICLHTQLKRPQIFLKRKLCDIHTNAFNKTIANTWYANKDIQFILDPYATATYCTSYMTKVDKSITTKLKSIIQKCIEDKTHANKQILKLGNAFLNAQQMSAQLVVYLILSLPLYHSSRSFKFMNTSPLGEPAFFLKPQKILSKLNPESRNVMCKSIIDRYIERPQLLNHICLAEFASNYYWLKNKIIKCKTSKTIRFAHYNKHRDLENWTREQLLLYVPFFNTEASQKNNKETWKEAYNEKINNVITISKKFNYQIATTVQEDCNEEWDRL